MWAPSCESSTETTIILLIFSRCTAVSQSWETTQMVTDSVATKMAHSNHLTQKNDVEECFSTLDVSKLLFVTRRDEILVWRDGIKIS